jgi:membrane-bound metal-dependent hydrolase YbcI (DUF457 family)
MPKEITHWTLASTVANKLPEGSLFFEPIRSFSNLFLLGAITPDIPFYYLAGPKTKVIQGLSAPFHGTDGRALLPALTFLDNYPDQNPAVLAFAAGVICHILADTLFHPLVYYFAGMDGVHPGATTRHREFETAMDLYFLHLSLGRSEVSLARMIKNLEVSAGQCRQFIAELFQARTRPERRYLGLALYSHMTLQYLFRSGLAYNAFAFLNRKTPWIPDKVVGLIYPRNRPVNLCFFSHPLRYRDPCTGEAFCARIQEMRVKTGEAGKKLLGLISTELIRGGSAIGLMENPDLPDIRPGFARDRFFFWRGKYDLASDLYGVSGCHDFFNKERRSQ